MTLRAATRGSPLARWQTDRVATLLGTDVEVVVIETAGDRDRTSPLHEIGGQGVFVKEVQAAVLDGRADIAVHSAKDLPSTTADGLALACVPERDDPRDALVGAALADLGTGAVVGTGSVRRRAQLAHARPDLRFAELRGNMATRLGKAAEFDAVVVAHAAVRRLGRAEVVAEVLDLDVMVPQVAQGALAVECRVGDDATFSRLAAIEDADARRCVDAERAFLAELGSGCELPVGALAVVDGDALSLTGLVASADGAEVLRHCASGTDPVALGRAVARHLLDVAGGAALLAR